VKIENINAGTGLGDPIGCVALEPLNGAGTKMAWPLIS
jgi:hypothetical protein